MLSASVLSYFWDNRTPCHQRRREIIGQREESSASARCRIGASDALFRIPTSLRGGGRDARWGISRRIFPRLSHSLLRLRLGLFHPLIHGNSSFSFSFLSDCGAKALELVVVCQQT
jgi:hypothetical protein